jgi:hypothetical protein
LLINPYLTIVIEIEGAAVVDKIAPTGRKIEPEVTVRVAEGGVVIDETVI